MVCQIKNIPEGSTIYSGNRGIGFPYNICDLPPDEVCFLAADDSGSEIAIIQQNGEQIILRCIE